MTWRFTSASEPGTSHLRRGLACQDAHASWQDRGSGTAVLAVADGAGSARRAGDGSRIAVITAVDACMRRLTASEHGAPDSAEAWEGFLRYTLEAVRYEIERAAAEGPNTAAAQEGLRVDTDAEVDAEEDDGAVDRSTCGSDTEPKDDSNTANGTAWPVTDASDGVGAERPVEPFMTFTTVHETESRRSTDRPAPGAALRELSTTLLVAVLAPRWLACLQVGDGVIVARHGGGLEAITRPAKGEYANQTDFVTMDEYVTRAQIRVLQRDDVDALAVMSDGLEALAVELASNTPFAPFFESLFAFASSDHHVQAVYSEALAQELRSDKVNRLTDDDKTLVVATRTACASEQG